MIKYRLLYHYSVCGNVRQGFEVNDSRYIGYVQIPEKAGTRAIFRILRDELAFNISGGVITIPPSGYCGGHMDLQHRRSGKPFAFLERVHEKEAVVS